MVLSYSYLWWFKHGYCSSFKVPGFMVLVAWYRMQCRGPGFLESLELGRPHESSSNRWSISISWYEMMNRKDEMRWDKLSWVETSWVEMSLDFYIFSLVGSLHPILQNPIIIPRSARDPRLMNAFQVSQKWCCLEEHFSLWKWRG